MDSKGQDHVLSVNGKGSMWWAELSTNRIGPGDRCYDLIDQQRTLTAVPAASESNGGLARQVRILALREQRDTDFAVYASFSR